MYNFSNTDVFESNKIYRLQEIRMKNNTESVALAGNTLLCLIKLKKNGRGYCIYSKLYCHKHILSRNFHQNLMIRIRQSKRQNFKI